MYTRYTRMHGIHDSSNSDATTSQEYEELAKQAHVVLPEPEPVLEVGPTQMVNIITFDNQHAVPAIKRPEEIINCAMQWYQSCDVKVEIINTTVFLPMIDNISLGDSFPVEELDFYMNQLLPIIEQQAQLTKKMQDLKMLFNQKKGKKNAPIRESMEWNVDNIYPYNYNNDPFLNSASKWSDEDAELETEFAKVPLSKHQSDEHTHKPFMPTAMVVSFDSSQTFILTHWEKEDYDLALRLLNCEEFKFRLEFSTDAQNLPFLEMMKVMFNEKQFESDNQLAESVQHIKRYTETHSVNEWELNKTTEIIHNKFEIIEKGDESVKLKSSVICDIVSKQLSTYNCFKSCGFKNRLADYLCRLGLQKKRYSDGYYYHAIRLKECNSNNSMFFFGGTKGQQNSLGEFCGKKTLNYQIRSEPKVTIFGPGTDVFWNESSWLMDHDH